MAKDVPDTSDLREKSLLLQAKHIFRHHAEKTNCTISCGRLNTYVFVYHISFTEAFLHCVLPLAPSFFFVIGPALSANQDKFTMYPPKENPSLCGPLVFTRRSKMSQIMSPPVKLLTHESFLPLVMSSTST